VTRARPHASRSLRPRKFGKRIQRWNAPGQNATTAPINAASRSPHPPRRTGQIRQASLAVSRRREAQNTGRSRVARNDPAEWLPPRQSAVRRKLSIGSARASRSQCASVRRRASRPVAVFGLVSADENPPLHAWTNYDTDERNLRLPGRRQRDAFGWRGKYGTVGRRGADRHSPTLWFFYHFVFSYSFSPK
jgi:hypothetical protein